MPEPMPTATAMTPAEPAVLSDGVVMLRGLRADDLPAVIEQCNDPEMVRFTTIPQPYGRAEAEGFLAMVATNWRDGSSRCWSIEVVDPAAADRRGAWAGSLEYHFVNPVAVEVAWSLHPAQRGRGYGSRAVLLLLEHIFAETGAQVIHWRAVVGNWASRRVAWRCGFRHDGMVPALLDNGRGQVDDGWVASLRRADPRVPRHRWPNPPTWELDSVRIRPWRDEDALPVEPDPECARLLGERVPTAATYPSWLLAIRERAAVGELVYWCLADPATDAVLGGMLLFDLNGPAGPVGRFGYWLLAHARGRGVVAQAAQPVLSWAFADPAVGGLGRDSIGADAVAGNEASIRCLRRAGFAPVGVRRRGAHTPAGQPVDVHEFDLLPTDLGLDPAAW